MINSIHTLIHSLTQSEKRYFNIQASIGFEGNRKHYWRLYEAILHQKTYDENQLKEQFGSQHFAQYKKQLEEKILESLRQYHAGKSVTDILNQEIVNIRLFEQKSLLKRAVKSLQRAEELARRYELLPELLRIFEVSVLLISKTETAKNIRNRIETLRKEIPVIHQMIDVSLLIRQEYLYFVTLNKENEFLRHPPDAQTALSLTQSLDLAIRNQPLPALALTQFHYLNGLCFFLCGLFEESRSAFLSEHETFKKHPFLMSQHPELFNKCLANNVLLALTTGKNQDYIHFFNLMSEQQEVGFYHRYLLQLKYLVGQKQWRAGKELIEANQNVIRELENEYRLNNLMKTELDYVLFDTLRIHLESGEFREARLLLHTFFSYVDTTQKTDNYIMARIVFLLLHIQLEQYELAESEWRSLQRFIKNNKRKFEFETLSLKYLSRIIADPLREKQRKTINSFIHELEQLGLKPEGRMALFCFDLSSWLRNFKEKM